MGPSRRIPKRRKKRKIQRGKRRSKKRIQHVSPTITFLGTNGASVLNKRESLERNINLFKPSVFFIQESKARMKNKMKLSDYTIFEYVRKNSLGGGLMTVVHNNLNPVSVCNEDEEEVLVVEVKVAEDKLWLINGYGPQEGSENDGDEDKRNSFFSRLDFEIKRAKMSGAMVCLEMDAK